MTPKKKKGINYERPWRHPPATIARVAPKAKSNTEDASSMVGNQVHLYSEDNAAYNQKRFDYLTEMRNKRKVEQPTSNNLDLIFNDIRLNDYEKIEAVKRKAE
jgi:thymidylate synthase